METEILKIMDIFYRKDDLKRLFKKCNRYEKVFVFLKYKIKINHYGEIV